MNQSPGSGTFPEFDTTLRLQHETLAGIIRLGEFDGLKDLEQTFLTPGERSLCLTLRHPMRRREWVGARAALKILLLREGIIRELYACEIRKGLDGRPSLYFPAGQETGRPVDCSLSHKDRYAMAAFTTAKGVRLGADLEEISPRLVRLRSHFINEQDSLLASPREEVGSAILWAMKEAASKVSGQGLRTGLWNLVCLEKRDKTCRIIAPQGPPLEATYFFLEDHVAAVAWAAGDEKSLDHFMEKR